jgi:hypothetical protein
LNAKHEVRLTTCSPGTLASALISSSVIPSANTSFSGDGLRLANGNTAMEGSVPRAASPTAAPRPQGSPSRSAAAIAPAPGNRSAGTAASARSTMRSIAGGTARPVCEGAGAVAVKRLAMMAAAVGPVNGGSPQRVSNRTQPRL